MGALLDIALRAGSKATKGAKAASITSEAAIKEAFEERAAIMEFDGGLTRREAERLALLEFMPEGKPN